MFPLELKYNNRNKPIIIVVVITIIIVIIVIIIIIINISMLLSSKKQFTWIYKYEWDSETNFIPHIHYLLMKLRNHYSRNTFVDPQPFWYSNTFLDNNCLVI